MMSRLLSLLRMFPRANAAAIAEKNSWAKLSLWRRYFEMKEEEEEERIESVVKEIKALLGIESDGTVMSEEAIELRRELLREHYRKIAHEDSRTRDVQNILSFNDSGVNHTMQEYEQQQISQPNLDIPVNGGESYVNLAQ